MPWSDWQDGWTAEFAVGATNGIQLARVNPINFTRPDAGGTETPVPADVMHDLRDGMDADGIDEPFTPVLGELFRSDANTSDTAYGLGVDLGYQALTVQGSVFADFLTFDLPPGLPPDAGLIPDAESGPNQPNGYIEYESSDTTFAGWAPYAVETELAVRWDSTPDDTTLPQPDTIPLTYWATDPVNTTPSPGFPISGSWLTYEDGQVLTHQDVPVPPLSAGVTAIVPFTAEIALDDWGSADVMIVAQSRYQEVGTDFPATATRSMDNSVWGWEWRASASTPTSVFGRLPNGLLGGAPGIRYQMPRWRYWIDDSVYVFGGHYAELPGAPQIQVKKSDGTWIPIIDGLAPPLI